MNKLGLAAALALAASAQGFVEPQQAPQDVGERRKSRHRIGATTPAKDAKRRRIKAYKVQRAANRQRRKLEARRG